ncbi:MAG: PRC-barrel domain-containing protein [Phenylobacterium sp.]|uniref:PRC-barrel domain-containing protein n=1 Tax=Phenylobacterium sp. TaxID=1871053 RepID=UPI002734CE22|nr:PRC-barrel domain-containing protein [Phenylobacterium sp.]MDP3747463.1 PRC-barrel domain-containing protein [Phenylobacterium sp.]
MATETSPHHLIMTSRVTGTPVFNPAGDRMGHVEDLSAHKVSGQLIYAILSIGGFLGIGDRLHPLPWSMLDYDTDKGGFVVPLDKSQIEAAPSLSREELEGLGAGDSWRTRLFDYYGPYGAVPYV